MQVPLRALPPSRPSHPSLSPALTLLLLAGVAAGGGHILALALLLAGS